MAGKRNAMIRRQFMKAAGAGALGALSAGTATGDGGRADRADRSPEELIDVKVFVVAAFEVAELAKRTGDSPGEFQLWYDNYGLTERVDVPGAFAPVYHDGDGVAGTITGIGKANAAASLTAVLSSPRFDFEDAYFVTAGIAGSPPDVGTLGSVFVSDLVVDWDLVHRWSRADGPADPHAMMPRPNRPDHVRSLDGRLVEAARRLSADVELVDSERAREYRRLYPQETARSEPFVGVGTTVCGDTYWHGETFSAQATYLSRRYDASAYVTTEMEDYATATVLDRFGHLDRYLSLRSVSNFDRPHPGQTVRESLAADSGGFAPSVTNVFRVGSAVVDAMLDDWPRWREGVPEALVGACR